MFNRFATGTLSKNTFHFWTPCSTLPLIGCLKTYLGVCIYRLDIKNPVGGKLPETSEHQNPRFSSDHFWKKKKKNQCHNTSSAIGRVTDICYCAESVQNHDSTPSAKYFGPKWKKKKYARAPLSELKCSEFKFACTSTHPSKYWSKCKLLKKKLGATFYLFHCYCWLKQRQFKNKTEKVLRP